MSNTAILGEHHWLDTKVTIAQRWLGDTLELIVEVHDGFLGAEVGAVY